jgi:hypothetical protein
VIETICHLELLAARGVVARAERADGTVLYAARA